VFRGDCNIVFRVDCVVKLFSTEYSASKSTLIANFGPVLLPFLLVNHATYFVLRIRRYMADSIVEAQSTAYLNRAILQKKAKTKTKSKK